MNDEFVELLERSLIEKEPDAFPSGHLTARLLLFQACFATALFSQGTTLL